MASALLRPCPLKGAPFQSHHHTTRLQAPATRDGASAAVTAASAPGPAPVLPQQQHRASDGPSTAPAPPPATTACGVSSSGAPNCGASSISSSISSSKCTSSAASSVAAGGLGRREMLVLSSSLVVSQLAALALAAGPSHAGERGMARYIRKRTLDPLETYVPVVLDARDQLLEAGSLAVADPLATRNMLRSGAFAGLRDSAKAVGEYAAQAGNPNAGELVTTFFRQLEGLDFLAFNAVRDKQQLTQEQVDERVNGSLVALDKLIATVPEDILSRSREVLLIVREKEAAALAAALAAEEEEAAALAKADATQLQRELLVPVVGP